MRTPLLHAALTLLLVAALPAQEGIGQRDFLSAHEVEIIRANQELDQRIDAYMHFAAMRLELVRQLLENEEAGRGAKIHRNLEEYGRILEAVDMVVEDALLKGADAAKLMEPLAEKQREFLAILEEIDDSDPEDLWRYEFVLEDAIEITSDSIELAMADLGERKRELIEADDAEKDARERTMSAERRAEVEKARKAQERKAEEFETKRPTLLKKEESLDDANQRTKKKP